MVRIVIDPATRTAGGLRVAVDMADGSVVDARCSGTAYRGLEQMLVGRDPRDAVYLAQRICGQCPASHAIAAAGAVESLAGAAGSVPKDALVIRNILSGLSWLRNHLESLYLLFLPDLASPIYRGTLKYYDAGGALLKQLAGRFNAPGYGAEAATAPGTSYVAALRCMKLIAEAEALLAGRSPHGPAIVPGGVTARPTAADLARLKELYGLLAGELEARFTAPLTLDEWLRITHLRTANPNDVLDRISGLPASDLSAEAGWNDLLLFSVFGSRMMSNDFLGLPVYIELDTLGGYPLMDSLLGFLSNGAFFQVRGDDGAFRDGYAPADAGQPGSFYLPSGFTPGSLQNMSSVAETVDPDQIVEQVAASFYTYAGTKTAVAPAAGETSPALRPADIAYDGQKYSFVKAPRYGNVPCEVGPLARMINSREPYIYNTMLMLHNSNSRFSIAKTYAMTSVYTRVLARLQETLIVAQLLGDWIGQLEAHSDPHRYCVPVEIKPKSSGFCLTEAPRGALGHWARLDANGLIASYQVVAPTTWNASPRDGDSKYGPLELALIGIKTTPRGNLPGSESDPVGIYHTIRSFDPCISCAVHTVRRR